MKLSELLSTDRIRIPLRSTTKTDVLREMITLVPGRDDAEVREQLLQAVLDRESRMSTGIGRGVAIPHGKCDLVDRMEVAFGVAPRPLDYESLDGEPVSLFFLLLSPPDAAGPHIKVLAQISRLLSSDDLREGLIQAGTPAEALEMIRGEERDDDD
jgi:PTS system fructose-specific IIC component